MQIVAIIPARGGSQGIPGKNIRNFCGRPLIAWSILQAKAASGVGAVYVTSDSDAILAVAKEYGAIPIKRPAEFATSTASSESALLHALNVAEQNGPIDTVLFLQCTSPLRATQDIDQAVTAFHHAQADSLLSVTRTVPLNTWEYDEQGELQANYDYVVRKRRQDKKPQFHENGSFYIFKPDVLRQHQNRLGGKIIIHEIPEVWKELEIDTPEDWEICETFFLRKGLAHVAGTAIPELKLLVFDFDGVMTDNRVWIDENGRESVACNRSDGLAISLLRQRGLPMLILSTETNTVVRQRAAKLKLPLIDSCDNKLAALTNYCTQHGISLSEVAYFGNDLNDRACMAAVGLPVAPADAAMEIKLIAKYVTNACGGNGVVREFYNLTGGN